MNIFLGLFRVMVSGTWTKDDNVQGQNHWYDQGCILLFKKIISFVYISNDIPLPSYPSTNPHPRYAFPLPYCLYEGAPQLTHILLPHCSSILLGCGIKPPLGPRASLPISLRQDHPLLHIYLKPWTPLGTHLSWWSRCWENWVVRLAHVGLPIPLCFSRPSASTATRFPELSLMVDSKNLNLHCQLLAGPRRNTRFLSASTSSPQEQCWVWCLQMWWS